MLSQLQLSKINFEYCVYLFACLYVTFKALCIFFYHNTYIPKRWACKPTVSFFMDL